MPDRERTYPVSPVASVVTIRFTVKIVHDSVNILRLPGPSIHWPDQGTEFRFAMLVGLEGAAQLGSY